MTPRTEGDGGLRLLGDKVDRIAVVGVQHLE